jgi:hypothetical protein
MAVTTDQAIAAVRARLNSGSYSYPLYYHGDQVLTLPDTPAPFGFVIFNNEGSTLAGFGGGRGNNLYRNRARVEVFVFAPRETGLEWVCALAETVATRLRSYLDDSIACFQADVIPIGPGATLSVPGLSTEVNNYQCAVVESLLFFDLIG